MGESKFKFMKLPYVIYFDQRLDSLDKTLFCRIYALSMFKGYCWVSNSTLAKENGKTANYISKRITRLKRCGYINIAIDKTALNNQRRKIYVNEEVLELSDYEDEIEEDMSLSL